MIKDEEGNIVSLASVKPKTHRELYKKVPIKLIYTPLTKKWQYEITIVSSVTYKGESDTEAKALRDAKKYIDKQELGK